MAPILVGSGARAYKGNNMGRSKILECIKCEAVFKVQHDMDEHFYIPEFCTFCGEELEFEEELELEAPEEE